MSFAFSKNNFKPVWGVQEPKPIVGLPPGKQRLRMRVKDAVKVYVRTEMGVRCFVLSDCGTHWGVAFETGRNYRPNESTKPAVLNLKVVRDDSLPAFGGWHSCKDKSCPNNNTILLNLEAHFGAQCYEDGSLVDPLSPQEAFDVLLETLMHEFGHAVQQYFKREMSEEQLEAIIESFRNQQNREVAS